MQHWFWFLLMLACLIWYSTITIYIAIKGAFDIKHMLRALEKLNHPELQEESLEGHEAVKQRN